MKVCSSFLVFLSNRCFHLATFLYYSCCVSPGVFPRLKPFCTRYTLRRSAANVMEIIDFCFYVSRLSTMDKYYIPKDGALSAYKEYISMLPNVDNPEAFGQHPNADIASQITEARNLFETLLSLQPKIATKTGVSQEEKVCLRKFCDFVMLII